MLISWSRPGQLDHSLPAACPAAEPVSLIHLLVGRWARPVSTAGWTALCTLDRDHKRIRDYCDWIGRGAHGPLDDILTNFRQNWDPRSGCEPKRNGCIAACLFRSTPIITNSLDNRSVRWDGAHGSIWKLSLNLKRCDPDIAWEQSRKDFLTNTGWRCFPSEIVFTKQQISISSFWLIRTERMQFLVWSIHFQLVPKGTLNKIFR